MPDNEPGASIRVTEKLHLSFKGRLRWTVIVASERGGEKGRERKSEMNGRGHERECDRETKRDCTVEREREYVVFFYHVCKREWERVVEIKIVVTNERTLESGRESV